MFDEYKYTREDLEKMQSRDYGSKVNITISKILEALRYTDFNMFVTFSGGKDSEVLLDLVASVWSMTKDIHNDKKLTVIFANTSNEFFGMESFVKRYCLFIEKKHGISIDLRIAKGDEIYRDVVLSVGYPVVSKSVARKISDVRRDIKKYNLDFNKIQKHILFDKNRPKSDFIESAEYCRSCGFKDGAVLYLTGVKSDNSFAISYRIPKQWFPLIQAPFDISDKCCERLKKAPMRAIENEISGSPFIGEMASDSQGRQDGYLKTGCNAFYDNKKAKSKPMGFWLEQDVLRYINENELPFAPVYGELRAETNCVGECIYKFTREQRTGCKLCMFGIKFDKDRFKRLNEYEPATMSYAMKPVSEGGLGYSEVIGYMNKYCNAKITV
jgi:3'-phosphoadenosine 5'-phosphosulfate sulfotransferase (PAPS reductase)/FAD synthetase